MTRNRLLATLNPVLAQRSNPPVIAVVIPCFKVTDAILCVLSKIGDEVSMIFVVDDKCPDGSGRVVREQVSDPRVQVIFHEENAGVGGAVMSGYKAALAQGADIVVKVDGDGQMDPGLLPRFIRPLVAGIADYTKGNRFFSRHAVRQMPTARLFGNAALSFFTKLSSGYWSIFDPTNGYTAIHRAALAHLNFDTISKRYFFESDMLVSLGNIRATVMDIPMEALYGEETSHLKISKVIPEFAAKHTIAMIKRIIYNYFLRDFSFASLCLLFGVILFFFGVVFGGINWWHSIQTDTPAASGTVMIAMVTIILGFQLLLSFLNYDISNEPSVPLQVMNDGS